MSGITSDNVQVMLTPEKPHADVVMTFEGKNILGIKNINQGIEVGSIYPNPMVDMFNLPLNLKEGSTLKLEIFNQMGQMVSFNVRNLGAGQSLLSLPVSGLGSGIYTLKVSSEKGTMITKKFIIAR
jgi:hypothetical protein